MNRKFGQVTVAMTTFPARWEYSIRVIHALANQCDFFKLCLNQFDSIPQVLLDMQRLYKNVEIILANGKNGIEDLGCLNKMRFLPKCDGYYITVDDDIIYPPNYIDKLTEAIDKYDGRAVCSFHGIKYATIDGVVWPDSEHRTLLLFARKLEEDTRVHTIGMGVGGCVPKRIGMCWNWYSKYPKNQGDDEITAMNCWKTGVPLMCINHPHLWISPVNIHGLYSLSSDKKSRENRYNFMRNNIPFSKLDSDNDLSVTYIVDENENTNIELCCSLLSCIRNGGIKTFNILTSQLSNNTKMFVEHCRNRYGATVQVFDIPEELLEKCREYNAKTNELKFASASSIALSKYEICNLISDTETLYLDTDTIILQDLLHLKKQLKNSKHYLFAVEDPFRRHCDVSVCPYAKNEDYFNSGVLLMNLERFRDKSIPEKLWEAKKNCVDNRLTDQNGFNMVFHGNVELLPRIYNDPTSNPQIKLDKSVILHFIGAKHKFNREDPKNKCLVKINEYLKEVTPFFSKNEEEPQPEKNDRTESPAKSIGLPNKVSFVDSATGKHDAVFILGSGSSYNDLELLIAIHSMRKFCPFIDRIFVVGDKPKCNLSRYEITHVPCEDIFDRNKDANIMHKVLHAIKSIPDLTDNFLLCSDDQLVTRECSWNDFKPKYVKEYNPDDLTFGVRNDKGWRGRLLSTLSKAYERRGKAWFYEPHIWSPVNKKSFKAMIQSIKGLRNAGVVFSQYYNSIDNLDHEPLHDHMSFFSDSMDWSNEFKNPPLFISYSDVAFKNEEFRKQLALLLK